MNKKSIVKVKLTLPQEVFRVRLIYQLGRLDANVEFQKFKVAGDADENYVESELSSLFLKEYFEKKKRDGMGSRTKVILLYPVSLPFNTTLLKSEKLDKKLKEKIANIWGNEDEYLKNPYEFFGDDFVYGQGRDDLVVIHSIGKYLYGKEKDVAKEITFDTAYGDIVLEIFIDMVKRYLKENNLISEVYIDISSGHNIYISAMLEALRHFATFTNLRHWIDKRKRPKLFISICDPILPGGQNIHQVYIEEQRFVVFFESPLKLDDLEKVEQIFSNNDEFKKDVKNILERFLLTFSAIKNNIPLYLFDTYSIIDKSDEVRKVLDNVVECLHNKIKESYKYSPKLDKGICIRIINALGFYLGIIDAMNYSKISLYEPKKGILIKDVKDKVIEMYSKFGLTYNIDVLEVELDKLRGPDRKIDPELFKVRCNNYLKKTENKKDSKDRMQRNFFAHCGLEEHFICVVEKEEGTFVRYIDELPELRDTIKKMLLQRI